MPIAMKDKENDYRPAVTVDCSLRLDRPSVSQSPQIRTDSKQQARRAAR